MSMDYGSMSEQEAIDLLNIVYETIEEDWENALQFAGNGYLILEKQLEAIDHAQDALRDQLHPEEDSLRDQLVRDAIRTQETTA